MKLTPEGLTWAEKHCEESMVAKVALMAHNNIRDMGWSEEEYHQTAVEACNRQAATTT